jgi:chemotaxis protein MotB
MVVLLVLGCYSCVSQKEYNNLLGSKLRADHEVARLTEVEKEHLATLDELDKTYGKLAESEKTLAGLREENRQLSGSLADLRGQYDVLAENNRNLLAASSDEKKELTEQLSAQQAELDSKARRLKFLEEELKNKETALSEREKKIAALSEQLDLQKQSLQSLKTGLNQALRGFSAADLTVVERDGKIYVSMSQNLLFASGSKLIDKKGKDALVKLATVLQNSSDIDILVEGHTDTDGTADFNWDLSVARATAVVKELTRNGVDAKQLTAAGRAFFVPVASNETAEGKSRNRRTEIILSPRLDQLYKLLE